MGMIGYAKAGGEMARVFCLLTATVGMLAIFPISAESADDLFCRPEQPRAEACC
jgi:hypothetical protein